jgi:hypothetical protein
MHKSKALLLAIFVATALCVPSIHVIDANDVEPMSTQGGCLWISDEAAFVWGDLFLLASGIGVRGNNPDSFDWKEWRHLEREKKEVKYFTIKYVSEKKISHLVTYQTHALAGISLRRKEPNPHGLVSCSDGCHKK